MNVWIVMVNSAAGVSHINSIYSTEDGAQRKAAELRQQGVNIVWINGPMLVLT